MLECYNQYRCRGYVSTNRNLKSMDDEKVRPFSNRNFHVKMATDKNENTLPKISSQVSEIEQNMDLKDKLALIDEELRQLYRFCVQEGFSPAQIERCAQPLLAVEKSNKRKNCLKKLAYFAVFVAVIAGVYLYSPVYNKVCIYAKLASMKVLPYWDWRYIYEEDCFISNPYKVDEALSEDECAAKCGNMKQIEKVVNTNHSVMAQHLFDQIPVVIKDATEDWRARKEFSVEFLSELYDNNQVLRDAEICEYQSTALEYDHPFTFLSAVVEGKVQGNYQTYWENCGKEGARFFRQFYRRPYFLPPMVEAGEGNFMIVSLGGTKSLRVYWSSNISWLSQITGKSRIILRPVPVCEKTCKAFTVIMETGDSILFSNDMWSISFKPIGEEPVIAIGASGTTF